MSHVSVWGAGRPPCSAVARLGGRSGCRPRIKGRAALLQKAGLPERLCNQRHSLGRWHRFLSERGRLPGLLFLRRSWPRGLPK